MSWGAEVVQEEARSGQVVEQVVGLVVQQQPELPSAVLVKPGLLRRQSLCGSGIISVGFRKVGKNIRNK